MSTSARALKTGVMPQLLSPDEWPAAEVAVKYVDMMHSGPVQTAHLLDDQQWHGTRATYGAIVDVHL